MFSASRQPLAASHMDDSLHDERFFSDKAPLPLRQNVEQLALDAEQSLSAMEGRKLGDIFALACKTYGGQLPEFWRVWKDWHENDQVQDMGDL